MRNSKLELAELELEKLKIEELELEFGLQIFSELKLELN